MAARRSLQPRRNAPLCSTVSSDSKSWAEVAGNRMGDGYDSKLSKVLVEVSDGMVVYPQEFADEIAVGWANTLAGYIIDFKPHFPTLENHFRNIWNPKGSLNVISRGGGCFVIKFSEDDLKYTMEGGPWFVKGKPVLLKRWEPSEPLEKKKVN